MVRQLGCAIAWKIIRKGKKKHLGKNISDIRKGEHFEVNR